MYKMPQNIKQIATIAEKTYRLRRIKKAYL